VNSDQNINSENCYKETDQILQSSSPHPHTSTVENDPLHNGIFTTDIPILIVPPQALLH